MKEYANQLHKALKLFPPSNGNGRVGKLEDVVTSLEKENLTLKTRVDLLQKQVQTLTSEVATLKTSVKDLVDRLTVSVPEDVRRELEKELEKAKKQAEP